MYNRPKSVLDHGGDSESAITHTISERAAHHENEVDALYAGSGKEPTHERHMEYLLTRTPGSAPVWDPDYPRHVHSVSKMGDWLNVDTPEQHKAAISSGEWSDTPMDSPSGGAANVPVVIVSEAK